MESNLIPADIEKEIKGADPITLNSYLGLIEHAINETAKGYVCAGFLSFTEMEKELEELYLKLLALKELIEDRIIILKN